MIHYHGLPITPVAVARAVITGGHAFVSFRTPSQLGVVLEVCQSFAVDNGAFSAWRSGKPVQDWTSYYSWVDRIRKYPSFDFAVIPDVIDGDEKANDDLIAEWPWSTGVKDKGVGAPVWHLHESLERLQRLAEEWPRVCLGSSGEYSTVGNDTWWERIDQAMSTICDSEGIPSCKLHGLRMLNPKVFSRLPFSSADSTNIARNVGIDSNWRGTYTPPNREVRGIVMRERIESHQASVSWSQRSLSSRAGSFSLEDVND